MPPLHHDHVLSNGCIQRCIQCDLLFNLPILHKKQRAYCPRCRAKIAVEQDWSLNRLMMIVIAMLVLMPSALISIRLLGSWIDASLFSSIWQISRQGNPFTARMVALYGTCAFDPEFFSALFNPRYRMGLNLRPVLLILEQLKEWVMLDMYLIGVIVTCIKVNEYAEISAGVSLIDYLFLTLLTLLILIYLNVKQLWQRFYAQPSFSLGCYERIEDTLFFWRGFTGLGRPFFDCSDCFYRQCAGALK